MGTLLLVVLFAFEIGFLVWSFITKSNHTFEKNIGRIVLLALLVILLVIGVFIWEIQYYGIMVVVSIQVILGIIALSRKSTKTYSAKKIVAAAIGCLFLYLFAVLPAILFPQFKPIQPTGSCNISTASFVWTDLSRTETFANTGENRFVNTSFWYPEENGEYPLIVFSHGAFGVPISNESTYNELASNGYVVASIGHPYHSFYTQDAQGKTILADTDFINSVYAANELQNEEEQKAITDQWMEIRLADMNFVLDTILQLKQNQPDDILWSKTDTKKIGLMGHSLGGATAAQLARERNDIDSIVVLDGTMLGELVGFDNNKQAVFNQTPYPVPLFNIYRQAHYEEALVYGENYENLHAAAYAVSSYSTVFKDTGHMNFTDLPLFSPMLAELLDKSSNATGNADSRLTIETMNKLVLEFFNYTLKDGSDPHFEKEY